MAGEVEVLAKLKPKADAFVGIVDASQTLVDATGFTGNLQGVTGVAQDMFAAIDALDVGGGGGGGSASSSFGVNIRNTSGIVPGAKFYKVVPVSCTITGWTLIANTTGNITLEISKCAYADYPSMTSITGSNYPALSASDKASDQTLTSWTTSITAGDIVEFYVQASDRSLSRVTIDVQYTEA